MLTKCRFLLLAPLLSLEITSTPILAMDDEIHASQSFQLVLLESENHEQIEGFQDAPDHFLLQEMSKKLDSVRYFINTSINLGHIKLDSLETQIEQNRAKKRDLCEITFPNWSQLDIDEFLFFLTLEAHDESPSREVFHSIVGEDRSSEIHEKIDRYKHIDHRDLIALLKSLQEDLKIYSHLDLAINFLEDLEKKYQNIPDAVQKILWFMNKYPNFCALRSTLKGHDKTCLTITKIPLSPHFKTYYIESLMAQHKDKHQLLDIDIAVNELNEVLGQTLSGHLFDPTNLDLCLQKDAFLMDYLLPLRSTVRFPDPLSHLSMQYQMNHLLNLKDLGSCLIEIFDTFLEERRKRTEPIVL